MYNHIWAPYFLHAAWWLIVGAALTLMLGNIRNWWVRRHKLVVESKLNGCLYGHMTYSGGVYNVILSEAEKVSEKHNISITVPPLKRRGPQGYIVPEGGESIPAEEFDLDEIGGEWQEKRRKT